MNKFLEISIHLNAERNTKYMDLLLQNILLLCSFIKTNITSTYFFFYQLVLGKIYNTEYTDNQMDYIIFISVNVMII